jgi:uncharacterized protein YpmB
MNKKTLYIIIGVLVLVIVVGGFFLLTNKKGGQQGTQSPASNQETQAPVADTTMVDCGTAEDPSCFMGRANSCLPVKVKMVGSDKKTQIDLIILGIENDKCHFQRKLNGNLNLNCYFPKGTNIWNAIDQTFGNDRGLQKVVDDACAGW